MGHGGKRRGAGRPKKEDENRIRTLCFNAIDQTFGSEVGFFNHLASLAKSAKRDADKLAAIGKIMDYAYGKPSQSIDMTTNGESMNVPVKSWVPSDIRDKYIAQELKESIHKNGSN